MENFTQGILNAYLDHFLFNFFGLWISYRGLQKKSKNSKKCMEIKMLITKNY